MCAMKEPLTDFNCSGAYGKSLCRLSTGEQELNAADEDLKNASGRSSSIPKINKSVDTYFYDSSIINTCISTTGLQIPEHHRLVKERIDEICTEIELLHLDDFEEYEIQRINHIIKKYFNSNGAEFERPCEILQKKMISGQKRKVHEVYGKISSQQIGTNDEFVEERTKQVRNSLYGSQYLDEQTDISDKSNNKRIEIKSLTVAPMMSEPAFKYKSTSPTNILDLTTPISSITSAAGSETSFSSKTLSLSENESTNTCKAKSQTLLKSISSISSDKMFLSVSTSKSQSSFTSKSQDEFKTKSASFSKYEPFSTSRRKYSSSTKYPSPSVSTTKSQTTSKTNSPLIYESSKMLITKSRKAPKTKFSSLMSESRTITNHPHSRSFKEHSSTVSNGRFKKQRTHVLKNIQQKITSPKTDPTKLKMLEKAKTMVTNKNLASKIKKRQMENYSCIRKFKECKKVKNDAKQMVSSMKFVIKDLRSSSTSVVDSLTQNIRKDVSVPENVTDLDSMVDTSIKTRSDFKNISVSQNTAAANILNVNSKSSSRQRIIYDENKEEQRKRAMTVIKAKEKLLKDKIMEGKYSHNKKVKNKLIRQAKAIQSEIDKHFHHLDKLGKMPNHPEQNQLVKPKVNKTENIKNLQILFQHLTGKITTEVNIENIHEYLNCETFKEAFDRFQKIKSKQLKKIETSKQKMNRDLQKFDNFLKLNREKIFSNASFPNSHYVEDILSNHDLLRKAVGSNLRYLISLQFLTSNLMKSIRNYRLSEKLLFNEWNRFVFEDHESFFTLRKVR